MRTLGIIPARGGSKRIPRKNLVDLGGKPLVAWTIEAALKSNLDHVVVSSEDEEIIELAQSMNCEWWIRKPDLAEDAIHAVEVVRDVLNSSVYGFNLLNPDIVCMLQPTSPFRTAEHINDALHLFTDTMQQQGLECFSSLSDVSIVGVTRCRDPLLRFRSIEFRQLVSLVPYGAATLACNSQESESVYVVNGAMFIISPEKLKRHGTFHSGIVLPFIMDERSGLDIDTPEDFLKAEVLVDYPSIEIYMKEHG